MLVLLLSISSKTPLNSQFSSAAHVQTSNLYLIPLSSDDLISRRKKKWKIDKLHSIPPKSLRLGGCDENEDVYWYGGKMVRKVTFRIWLSSWYQVITWQKNLIWICAADENWKLRGVFDEIERRMTNMMINLKLMEVNWN